MKVELKWVARVQNSPGTLEKKKRVIKCGVKLHVHVLGSKVSPPVRLLWQKLVCCFNVNTDIRRDLEKCLELITQPSGSASEVHPFQARTSPRPPKNYHKNQTKADSRVQHRLHWFSVRHINKEWQIWEGRELRFLIVQVRKAFCTAEQSPKADMRLLRIKHCQTKDAVCNPNSTAKKLKSLFYWLRNLPETCAAMYFSLLTRDQNLRVFYWAIFTRVRGTITFKCNQRERKSGNKANRKVCSFWWK